MRTILCCAAILLLSGMAGCPSQDKVPDKVLVPVIKPCVDASKAPVKPQTKTEAELLAMDDYAATVQTWAERLNLKAYAEKAEAVISACR